MSAAAENSSGRDDLLSSPPVLPPQIPQYFVPVRGQGAPVYKPVLIGAAKVRYVDAKLSLSEERDILVLTPIREAVTTLDWSSAALAECCVDDLEKEPVSGAQFEPLPTAALNTKNYPAWTKAFAAWVFQMQTLELLASRSLGETSRPGESERDFRIRLQQKAREERDRVADLLRQKYAPKMAALEERKRRTEAFAGQQKAQQTQAVLQTALSVGSGLLTAFLGRRALSATTVSKAATAVRQAGRSWKESQDVTQAAENLETVTRQAEELQKQFEDELAARQSNLDPNSEALETVTIRPRKSDIELQVVALGWSS